jgi:hypothetical protein
MIFRFALFAGDYYYPEGGWDDLVATFNSRYEAEKHYEKHQKECGDWYHIIDLSTGEKV